MDTFAIRSGSLYFMHDEWGADVLLERPAEASGTLVLMRLDNYSERRLNEVFDQFAAPEEYTFNYPASDRNKALHLKVWRCYSGATAKRKGARQ